MSEIETTQTTKRTLQGEVIAVMDGNNVKIKVETKKPHPKYGKIVKSHKNYIVKNLSQGEVKLGDVVTVEESKPISKRIKFVLLDKIK